MSCFMLCRACSKVCVLCLRRMFSVLREERRVLFRAKKSFRDS
jgi:hypothetical protein